MFERIFNITLILSFLACVCCKARELDGLQAIVTGGSRGIGEACAYALAKEGANVAIAVNISLDEAEEVVI